MAELFSQVLDLKKKDVFLETQDNDTKYFSITGLPSTLSYGKHPFSITFNDPEGEPLLKNLSNIVFEFVDSRGTVIFSSLIDIEELSGAGNGFVWIKKDPLRTADEIADGPATLNVMGELGGKEIPKEWQGIYNLRTSFTYDIRKDFPNTSPLVLSKPSDIQTNLSISETVEFDDSDTVFKRSFINVTLSDLETNGGKIESVELAYNEQKSKTDDFDIITSYPLTSGSFETDSQTLTSGLNPITNTTKIPTPKTFRRNTPVKFRLRFLSPSKQLAQYLDKDRQGEIVEVTSSFITFDSAPFFVEKTDNLLTGSLSVGREVGKGFTFSGKKSAELSTVDYKGFTSASLGLGPGILMYSGSVKDDITDDYALGGVGLELVANSESFFRFRTNPSELDIRTNKFFIGSETSQFVSASGGNIEISSSNFHLQPDGDVIMSGDITAETGNIGGFTIFNNNLKTEKFVISGSGGGALKTAETGRRIEILGTDNSLSFYSGSAGTHILEITDSATGLFLITPDSSGAHIGKGLRLFDGGGVVVYPHLYNNTDFSGHRHVAYQINMPSVGNPAHQHDSEFIGFAITHPGPTSIVNNTTGFTAGVMFHMDNVGTGHTFGSRIDLGTANGPSTGYFIQHHDASLSSTTDAGELIGFHADIDKDSDGDIYGVRVEIDGDVDASSKNSYGVYVVNNSTVSDGLAYGLHISAPHNYFSGNISGSSTSTGSFGHLMVGGGNFTSASLAAGGSGGSGISNVVEDTTPQLGGDLDLNSNDITGTGNIDIVGNITAQNFIVSSSVTSIEYQSLSGSTIFGDDSGDTHQFTGSINVSGSLNVNDGDLIVTDNVDVEGNIDINGTTNLDVVDIDGAVQIDGNTTFGVNGTGVDVRFYGDTSGRYFSWDQSSDQLKFQDDTKLVFGTGVAEADSDAQIYYDGSNLRLVNEGGVISLEDDVNVTGNVSGSSTSTGSFGRVETDILGVDILDLISTQTSVSPLRLTANSLNDNVGALRIDGSQPDIYLNQSGTSFTTVTFARGDQPMVGFGKNSSDNLYFFRETGQDGEPHTYDNTGFEFERSSGNISMGYNLEVAGNVSGSSTSTGSFGQVNIGTGTEFRSEGFTIDGTKGDLTFDGTSAGGGAFLTLNGGAYNTVFTIKRTSNSRASALKFDINGSGKFAIGQFDSDTGYSVDNLFIAEDVYGTNPHIEIQATSGNVVFHTANQKISGSSTSTGSFGRVESSTSNVSDNAFIGNRLGIGLATSPSQPLHIKVNNSNSDPHFFIENTNASGRSHARFWNSSRNTYWSFGQDNDDNFKIGNSVHFGTASTIKFTIKNSTGDIEIGGDISGSSTSTGSFGNLVVASTGSFGRIEVNSISASNYQGQIGSRYVHSQTSDSATWSINHNIGHKYPVVTVYDDSDQMILPETGTATDSDTFTLTFNEAIQGKAVVSVGGIGENAGGNYIFTQDSSTTNWRVTHSLSQQYPNVTVYDGSNQVIIPESITAASSNEMDITFSDVQSGYANFSIGSGIPNISSENAGKVLKVRYDGSGVEWSPTSSDVSGSMSVSGSILPDADNHHDLGSASKRWANLHTGDIQLSNEGSEGNEVDGTTGSWTIQEGEDDLYLLNRKNGKKYKFKLEEIT